MSAGRGEHPGYCGSVGPVRSARHGLPRVLCALPIGHRGEHQNAAWRWPADRDDG